jgi:tetratricopeptide (TPR) repeat protein
MTALRFLLVGSLAAGCFKKPPPTEGLGSGAKQAELDLWTAGPGGSKLYVEADLGDGKSRLFLLDTGADISALSEEVAMELGLRPVAQKGGVSGMGGRVQGWSAVQVPVVELGPFDVHGVTFAVGVPGVPTRAGLVPVAGILGSNVWHHFQMAVDYPAHVLELYRPGTMPIPEETVPLYLNRGHTRIAADLLVVDPSAEGGVREHPWELEVDTGAYDLVLAGSPMHAEPLVPLATTGEEPIFGIGADDSLPVTSFLRTTRRLPVKGVRIGNVVVEEPLDARWVDYSGQRGFAPPDMPGLIGHKLFEDHRLVLDFPGRRLALVPPVREARDTDIHAWALRQLKRSRSGEDVQYRAKLLATVDRLDDAVELLTDHVADAPDDLEATVLLSFILRNEGDPDAADQMLVHLTPEQLVEHDTIVEAVNSRWLAGDVAGSVELARAAVAAVPDSVAAMVALADALTAQEDYSGARRALADANTLADTPDGQLLRRAWVAASEGDTAAALTHFRRRLDLYPQGPFTPWLYAWSAQEDDLKALVERDIERAMARLHPGDGPLDFLAAAYFLMGKPEAAVELRARGASRDCPKAPTDASRDNCEAWYAGLVGQDLDEAWRQIRAAVDEEPHRSEYLDTLAVVAEARGDLDAARQAAREAARLSPADVYLLWQVRRLDAIARP